MMTDEPRRVTPAEICEFLSALRSLRSDAPLHEQIEFCESKARLLSRIAQDLDTPDAYWTAAQAWHQAYALTRQRPQGDAP